MSLNPNVRTEVLETLLNPEELSGFTALSKLLGISKSALNRCLINNAVRTNGIAPPPSRESRGCRGVGRPANRASGGKGLSSARRNL
jgi:hypothetical protein